MTAPSNTIEELVGRVAAATGPDRHIEGDIALALNQVPLSVYPHRSKTQPELWSDGKPGLRARTWMPPRYTASFDEALALAERLHGVHWYSILLDAVREFGVSGVKPSADLPRYIVLATLRSLRIKGDHNDEA